MSKPRSVGQIAYETFHYTVGNTPCDWEHLLPVTRSAWEEAGEKVAAHARDTTIAALERAETAIPMLLWCPACGTRHVDEGKWALKPHHTHACQACGMVWRPSIEHTVGVDFLPGFKDEFDGG